MTDATADEGIQDTPAGTTTSEPVENSGDEGTAKSEVVYGKGLDVGTANLVCGLVENKGKLTIRSERNAFLDINPDPFTRTMLNNQGVPYAVYNNKLCVIGQAAFDYANVVGQEVRRPMSQGMISRTESDALPMVKLMMERLVGKPRCENEPLAFSVPAPPVDSNLNVAYHEGILASIFTRFGYRALPVNEGLAVVFSELAQQSYSGIGISFGGGMANVCIAYRSVPAISFSVARSGDWVDTNAAHALGMKTPRMTMLKEKGMDIREPKSREEEGLSIFYRNLIRYVGEQMCTHMVSSDKLPEFPEPIDCVCSGGTSKIGGFVEVVKEEFERVSFPVDIREIRRATDPMTSTVRGCLAAAQSSA